MARTGDDCEPGPVASGGQSGCLSCNPGYSLVENGWGEWPDGTRYSTNYACVPDGGHGGGLGPGPGGCDPFQANASPRCCICTDDGLLKYGDDCTEERSQIETGAPPPNHLTPPMYQCVDDVDNGMGAGGIILIVLAVLVGGAFAGYFFVASKRRSSNHDDKKDPGTTEEP